jgi:HD-like signal output (HDOD) protein
MKQVLFVDDEPKLLEGLRRMLRGLRRQWNIEFVDGGLKALELMAAHPFDVVITDMRMPGMDGSQLLEEITARYPATVRIVLSGQCDRETILKAVQPAHQFLMKPCESGALQRTIERACLFQDMVADEHLRREVSRITAIPSIPSKYEELRSLGNSENADIEQIAKIIASDVAASAKVLQLVSSGFFGTPQKVIAPQRAVTLLGLETLQALAQSPQVFRPARTEEMSSVCMKVLDHSLEVARCAQAITACETDDGDAAIQAYVAGMLHDVGILVLIEILSEPEAMAKIRWPADEAVNWESETKHQTLQHLAIGGYLLGLWGLPDTVVNAAAFHHCPRLSSDTAFSSLTAVHVADVFASESDTNINPCRLNLDDEYLARIGCSHRIDCWRDICMSNKFNEVYQ